MGAASSNVSLLQDKEFKRVLTEIGSWRITECGVRKAINEKWFVVRFSVCFICTVS